MSDFKNRFSWSKSRHEKFEACRRQYFLHYYGSWGGWDRRAPAEVRELYLLKKLTNRWAWWGSTVHDAIQSVLTSVQAGRIPDKDRLLATVRASMRAQFRQSREGAYRARKAFGLVEHEYAEPVEDEAWRQGWEQVARCIEAFYGSKWMAIAQELPQERWLPIDQLDTFTFRDVPVYAAPDFAYRTDEGVVLVDWKTGQPRDLDADQLLGYALYARESWDVTLEGITCKIVYLPACEEVDVPVTHESVASFEERMAGSMERMLALLDDRATNSASIDSFPKTDDAATCGRCPFRRPCLGGAAPSP